MMHERLGELVTENGENGAVSQTKTASTGKIVPSGEHALMRQPSIPDGSYLHQPRGIASVTS
jgi:hypothetical protein